MTTAMKWLVGLGIAFLLVVSVRACQDAADTPVIKSLNTQSDSLLKALTLRGELFRTDTIRLRSLITRSETTLVQLIDTAHVYHTDTVKITVEKLVQIDSTIKVCKVTLSDCALGWAAEKQLTLKKDSLIQILKRKSNVLSRCGATLGYGVVLSGGRVLSGPSATAGCRVWP